MYFHCGGDFWAGFVAKTGATAQFLLWGNHIEDAARAVDIQSGGSKLVILGNRFNRNFRGIFAQGIPVNALVVANTFDCSSGLNTGASSLSYAGVELNGCPAATIGVVSDHPSARNYFKKQQYGVRLDNTTASIGLSDFRDNSAAGVWGNCSVIEIRGYNNSLRTNFRQNKKDIETFRSNLFVYYCNLDSCQKDNITSLTNNALQRVHISENFIKITSSGDSKVGISLDRTIGGNDNEYRNIIERNRLIISSSGYIYRDGIAVRGQLGTSDRMRIERDTIDMYSGGNENSPSNFINVYAHSADNYQILNNLLRDHIGYVSGQSHWGFFLHDGDGSNIGNMVSGNQVYGDGIMAGGCCAFHLRGSGPWTICNNLTDLTYRGFHFQGNCGPSVFGENIIKDHSFSPGIPGYFGVGLLIHGVNSDNGFIGDQCRAGNIWTMSSPTWYSARLQGKGNESYSQSTIDRNEFFVNNLNDPQQAPIGRDPMDFWFNINECEEVPDPCTSPNQPPRIDEYEWEVLTKYPQPSVFPNPEEWEDTRQLIKKLMRYPALATPGSDVLSFRNAYNESSAGRFARFDSVLNAALLVPSTRQAAMNAIEEAIRNEQLAINALDATVTDFSNPGSTFFVERAALLTQLSDFSNQRTALQSQILATRDPLLLACEQYNATLPENEDYEKNQKSLNALAIKQGRGIEFAEADYAVLHTIAQQCYEKAGATRDRAASMLPPGESAQYWREYPTYPECGENRGQVQYIEKTPTFKLSPNPTSDNLRIEFEKPFSGNLTVTDLSGAIVLAILDISEKRTVDIFTEKLPSGVYVLSSSTLPLNGKFVIIR